MNKKQDLKIIWVNFYQKGSNNDLYKIKNNKKISKYQNQLKYRSSKRLMTKSA